MRAFNHLYKYSFLLAFFLFLLPTNVAAWWWNDDYQCNDFDGSLNIMTINLLFWEINTHDDRLDANAKFAVDDDIHEKPFHRDLPRTPN